MQADSMEYQVPATSVETGAMPGAPYVVSPPMAMDGAYMTGAPYTTYGGYSMSPYMSAMPATLRLRRDMQYQRWPVRAL